MSAYSSAHSLIRFATDLPQYETDVVVIMRNINDLIVNYYAAFSGESVDPSYLVKYGRKEATGEIEESDVVISRIANSIGARISTLYTEDPPSFPENYSVVDGIDIFKRNLVSLNLLCEAHGTRAVFVTMPVARGAGLYNHTRGHSDGRIDPLPPRHEQFLRDFDLYSNAIRSLANSRKLTVVDMEAIFPTNRSDLFLDIVHYSNRGIEIFGNGLASALLSYR